MQPSDLSFCFICQERDENHPKSGVINFMNTFILALHYILVYIFCDCVLSRLVMTVSVRQIIDCSPPGSSVYEILQIRILEWLPCPPPGDLSNPRIEPPSLKSSALSGTFFTTSTTWEIPYIF